MPTPIRLANGDLLDVWNGPPVRYLTAVANQTANFGALTLAGAGGFKPVNGVGQEISLTSYDSLVSGSLGSYTPSISGGRLVFDIAGAPDAAVLRCSHAGGTVDITIQSSGTDTAGNALADTYSYASVADLEAIIALGDTTLSGKTAAGRSFSESISNRIEITSQTPASPFVITSHENQAVRLTQTADESTFYITSSSNINVKGLYIEHLGSAVTHVFRLNGSSDLIIEGNFITGAELDITQTYASSPTEVQAITASPAATNITIRNNTIQWFKSLIGGLGKTITGNVLQGFGLDIINAEHTTGVVIEDNFIRWRYDVVGAHSDAFQVSAANTADFSAVFNRNISAMAGGAPFQHVFANTEVGTPSRTITGRGNIFIGTHVHGVSIYDALNCEWYYNTMIDADGTASNPRISLGIDTDAGGNVTKWNAVSGTGVNATEPDNVVVDTADYTNAFTMTGWATPADLADLGNDPDPLTARDAVIAALGVKTAGDLDGTGPSSRSVGATADGRVTWATTVPGSDGSYDSNGEA